MKHAPRQQSASVNIGGKDVNIKIDLGGGDSVGPIHLAGDEKMPKSAVTAKSQQDMLMNNGSLGTSFANPTHNVHRLGIREGMLVADFGAGSGAYTLELANLVGDSGKVYAVDVQRDLLTRIQNEAVKQGNENVEIVWSDIETVGGVGIRDGLLHAVLLSNTLFQVDDKITVIKEAWRVLKPGGILAIIDWMDSYGGVGPQKSNVVTQSEATLLCTDNGFAFKNDFKAGEHHYGLLFVKMIQGQSDEEVLSAVKEKEKDFITRTIEQELV